MVHACDLSSQETREIRERQQEQAFEAVFNCMGVSGQSEVPKQVNESINQSIQL